MTPTIKSRHYAQPTGSPSSGEPVYLAVGKLRRPHGVHGEMLMEVFTDFPERLQAGSTLFVGETYRPFTIVSQRWHKASLLIRFEELQTREEAGLLRNQYVYVRVADLPPLSAGDYYHHQILGLQVVSEAGEYLGTVIDILETGANDVCIVRAESGQEFLLPFIDPVIIRIDLEAGELHVHLLPGIVSQE